MRAVASLVCVVAPRGAVGVALLPGARVLGLGVLSCRIGSGQSTRWGQQSSPPQHWAGCGGPLASVPVGGPAPILTHTHTKGGGCHSFGYAPPHLIIPCWRDQVDAPSALLAAALLIGDVVVAMAEPEPEPEPPLELEQWTAI